MTFCYTGFRKINYDDIEDCCLEEESKHVAMQEELNILELMTDEQACGIYNVDTKAEAEEYIRDWYN